MTASMGTPRKPQRKGINYFTQAQSPVRTLRNILGLGDTAMGQMPIVDLSGGQPHRDNSAIDWNEPQSPGTYRCVEGWESEGYQFGCLARATTETDDGQLRCTEHAHWYELRELRLAIQHDTQDTNANTAELGKHLGSIVDELDTVSDALWDINYTLMPLCRKMYTRICGWFGNRRLRRRQARELQQLASYAQINEHTYGCDCFTQVDEHFAPADGELCDCTECQAQRYVEDTEARGE